MIKNSKTAQFAFIISFAVFVLYLILYFVIGDVYRYALVGAIYEMLWLPMLVSLIVMPIFNLWVFIQNKGKSRIYAALAIISIIGAIIVMTMNNFS